MSLKPHSQIQKTKSMLCSLCRSTPACRRSNFFCSTFNVHLYVHVHNNNSKSFWKKWHETKRLKILPTVHSISLVHYKKKTILFKLLSSTTALDGMWGNRQTSLLVQSSTQFQTVIVRQQRTLEMHPYMLILI